MQTPDNRSGAYYVSVRNGRGQTMLALGPFRRHRRALGPFRRHRRALGLVDAARKHIIAAGLDPWHEYGYGTCRLPVRSNLKAGRFNAALHVNGDA